LFINFNLFLTWQGVRSWIKGLFKGSTTEAPFEEKHFGTTTVSTTHKYTPEPYRQKDKIQFNYNPTKTSTLPIHFIENDTFYKLKKFCESKRLDDKEFCEKKRTEIKDLIYKCDKLPTKNEACKEIDSIYCYVYDVNDYYFCKGRKHDQYVPGHRTPAPAPTTLSSKLTTNKNSPITSTRYNPYSWEPFTFKPFTFKPFSYEPYTIRPLTLSPFTYRTISIEYITSKKDTPNVSTTKKSTSTIAYSRITQRPTVPTTKSSHDDTHSPFGSATFTKVQYLKVNLFTNTIIII